MPEILIPSNLTLLLLMGAVFAATATLALVMTAPEAPATRLARYLARQSSPGAQVETMTVRQRLLAPAWQSLVELIANLTPTRMREATARDLVMAGVTMPPDVFLAIRGLVMVGLPLMVLMQVLSSGPLTWQKLALLVLSIVLGRRLPGMWLKRRIANRQRAIDRRLPYALDLLVACIEGGLSLDASMQKVVEQSDGPLAEEMGKTLQEITLGRPAVDAVRALGERTGAPGLKQVTSTIVQAERMGISIAATLRIVAQDVRTRRRQQAEEMARRAPLKMVPVLIFFVLPALAVVVMAPAVFLIRGVMQTARP